MPSRKRGGNPDEAGIPPRVKKDGYLPETALCVSGRYPKKLTKGEKRVAPSLPEDQLSKKGKHIAILRCGHQMPDPTKGWGMAAGAKEKKRKKGDLCPASKMPYSVAEI